MPSTQEYRTYAPLTAHSSFPVLLPVVALASVKINRWWLLGTRCAVLSNSAQNLFLSSLDFCVSVGPWETTNASSARFVRYIESHRHKSFASSLDTSHPAAEDVVPRCSKISSARSSFCILPSGDIADIGTYRLTRTAAEPSQHDQSRSYL